jgi:hypothetical protein
MEGTEHELFNLGFGGKMWQGAEINDVWATKIQDLCLHLRSFLRDERGVKNSHNLVWDVIQRH